MKVVVISDTHWMYPEIQIPECDLLLHAGDLEIKNFKEGVHFSSWWNNIEAKVKVVTPGNHDFLFERDLETAIGYLDNTYVLINESIVLDNGLVISGTPYTPRFMKWAFMVDDDGNADRYFGCISPETDIILSHGPAYGIHDEVSNEYATKDSHVGSKTLRKIIDSLDNRPRYLFQGHIHGNAGSTRHSKVNEMDIYNVSVADEDYKVAFKPLILEI